MSTFTNMSVCYDKTALAVDSGMNKAAFLKSDDVSIPVKTKTEFDNSHLVFMQIPSEVCLLLLSQIFLYFAHSPLSINVA